MSATEPVILPAHSTRLGDELEIRRALPRSRLPRVGAWCFLDHFGPLPLPAGNPGVRVGPHPHIGLQTVTWLLEGEILHRDSLGYEQLIRPGQLNLMTAGGGITHSEESPPDRGPGIHGLQLWIALPDAERHCEPRFEHHAELPRLQRDGMDITVFAGTGLDLQSPARLHSPLVGMDMRLEDTGPRSLPLAPGFEHGLLVTEGQVVINGFELAPGALLFLPAGRDRLEVDCDAAARLLLIGGEPFEEPLILWWNFVARRHEEIVAARAAWMEGKGFRRHTDYDGPPLEPPEISARLKPR